MTAQSQGKTKLIDSWKWHHCNWCYTKNESDIVLLKAYSPFPEHVLWLFAGSTANLQLFTSAY